jgi:hypothetical protein
MLRDLGLPAATLVRIAPGASDVFCAAITSSNYRYGLWIGSPTVYMTNLFAIADQSSSIGSVIAPR